MLGAVQGDRLIVVLGGSPLKDPDWTLAVVGRFVNSFAAGPVVVGPPVDHLMDTGASTREALSGYRAVVGWPEAPRPVSAHDLLPERALNGDGHARRALARELHDPLQDAGGGLLETLVVFLDQGLSVEADGPRRCSCTPTPSATGCAGCTRSAATARPIRATRTPSGWP